MVADNDKGSRLAMTGGISSNDCGSRDSNNSGNTISNDWVVAARRDSLVSTKPAVECWIGRRGAARNDGRGVRVAMTENDSECALCSD